MGVVIDLLLIVECIDEVFYVCCFNKVYCKYIKFYICVFYNGCNDIFGIVFNGFFICCIEYYLNYCYYWSYKKYYGIQV